MNAIKPVPSSYDEYRDLIQIEFAQIKDYIENTQEGLTEMRTKFVKRIDEHNKKFPDDILTIDMGEIMGHSEVGFSRILNETTFTSSYSVFEVLFKKLCDLVAEQRRLKFSINDFGNQRTVENCNKYIEKIIDIDISSLIPLWKEIDIYREIRNRLVHGNQADIKPSIKDFISKNKNIHYWNGDQFYINSPNFVVEFCDIAQQYLEGISMILGKDIIHQLD